MSALPFDLVHMICMRFLDTDADAIRFLRCNRDLYRQARRDRPGFTYRQTYDFERLPRTEGAWTCRWPVTSIRVTNRVESELVMRFVLEKYAECLESLVVEEYCIVLVAFIASRACLPLELPRLRHLRISAHAPNPLFTFLWTEVFVHGFRLPALAELEWDTSHFLPTHVLHSLPHLRRLIFAGTYCFPLSLRECSGLHTLGLPASVSVILPEDAESQLRALHLLAGPAVGITSRDFPRLSEIRNWREATSRLTLLSLPLRVFATNEDVIEALPCLEHLCVSGADWLNSQRRLYALASQSLRTLVLEVWTECPATGFEGQRRIVFDVRACSGLQQVRVDTRKVRLLLPPALAAQAPLKRAHRASFATQLQRVAERCLSYVLLSVYFSFNR